MEITFRMCKVGNLFSMIVAILLGERAIVCGRTTVCFEGGVACGAEASCRDTPARIHTSGSILRDEDSGGFKKDHVELGRSFQLAVSAHDWALAESFIPLADLQRLNDGLCIALDSIWFLRYAP